MVEAPIRRSAFPGRRTKVSGETSILKLKRDFSAAAAEDRSLRVEMTGGVGGGETKAEIHSCGKGVYQAFAGGRFRRAALLPLPPKKQARPNR